MYVFGIAGMALVLGKSLSEAAFLAFAFLPGDAIKAVIAGLVTQSLSRMRPASLLSRA
jgi:biotin transport system substrate-specific component